MNRFKAAIITLAIIGGTILTPAVANAQTISVAVSGPCTGASVPWIFHWSGWATFGWWFMTGCKSA